MLLDPTQLGFVAIIFGAYFVATVLGFGSSVLSVTFGLMLLPLDMLLPIVCPLNLCLSLYLAVRHRRSTRWRDLFRRLLPLTCIGVPFGLLLFNLRDMRSLQLMFGILVVVLAVLQLRVAFAGRVGDDKPLGSVSRSAMLIGGGVVHGLFSTGGPLIVYVLGREIEDKGAFRSTLSTMWVPMTAALLIDYASIGLFTDEVFTMIGWSIIPVALGLMLGEVAHARFGNRMFKRSVWILLLVGGVILSTRAAMSF